MELDKGSPRPAHHRLFLFCMSGLLRAVITSKHSPRGGCCQKRCRWMMKPSSVSSHGAGDDFLTSLPLIGPFCGLRSVHAQTVWSLLQCQAFQVPILASASLQGKMVPRVAVPGDDLSLPQLSGRVTSHPLPGSVKSANRSPSETAGLLKNSHAVKSVRWGLTHLQPYPGPQMSAAWGGQSHMELRGSHDWGLRKRPWEKRQTSSLISSSVIFSPFSQTSCVMLILANHMKDMFNFSFRIKHIWPLY